MTHLYTCVSGQHDLMLVLVAAAVLTVGMHTTCSFGRHLASLHRRRDLLLWGSLAVTTTAAAIWATHFIAMLAYDPGLDARFDLPRTGASFLVVLGLVGLASGILAARSDRRGRILAGGVLGLAISAMHYTGMSAYALAGHLSWDPVGVAAGLTLGCAGAALAGSVSASSNKRVRGLTPLCLILAVCAAHFVSMSAITVIYDPTVSVPATDLDRPLVGALVSGAAAVILALTVIALGRREARRRAAERRRIRALADLALEGLVICEGERIVNANASLLGMLGCTSEAVTGQSIRQILPAVTIDTLADRGEVDAWLVGPAGVSVPVRLVARPIEFSDPGQTVIAVRDQRARLRADAAMHELATRDSLTGLANRLQFNTALDERCALLDRGGATFAVLALDLDRFKYVNDTLGHPVGDVLLKRVAGRLLAVVPEADLVARLGGDEFAILTADLTRVRALAADIIEVLGRPFLIDGQVIDIGSSVGIAQAPHDARTPEALNRTADLALYRAKEDGRGIYRLFEPEMDARMQARRSLETALRRALGAQEFDLVYQPQIDARTGAFAGAEALIRWNDRTRGVVSPGEFIPLAEEIGLINRIGEWVLRTACQEARHWPEHIRLAVNLSPAQFRDPRLTSTIAGILNETDFPGSRLELEITESLMLQDNQKTLATLHRLRDLGIRISLDDFGTGYSSLSYLRAFPFDKIKIDRSFVAQTPNDPESAAILRAVVALGASLGMTTTAEGVETESQRAFIAAEGCDQIQGYQVSRPVSGPDLRSLFSPIRTAA